LGARKLLRSHIHEVIHMTELSNIRNFSIIAHIDHGKSTLADRLLEQCHAIDQRIRAEQMLDSMDLERERGITIKSSAVTLHYTAADGEKYVLNLIDTPGHVDFNYEVSRSLAACEGAILVVDASQGVEAQTLANTYLAIDAGLEVLPVINKIDLPSARPAEVKSEIEDIIGIPAEDAPEISAKNGINIPAVLEMIVRDVPAPTGERDAPLQALIFDSQYDSYRGVIVYTRIKQGTVKPGMDIKMMATGAVYKVVEVGTMIPGGLNPSDALGAGEVGYITASIKTVADTRVGDTVTGVENPAAQPLPGYRPAQPMVFSGIYPADGAKYQDLRDALEKLKLNDASMSYEPESSIALGFGFRCGFLGLLHMEIIQERLEREYNLDLITTAPNVVYRITKTNGESMYVYTPLDYPDPANIQLAEEPYAKVSLISPQEYVGNIMELCQNRRGEFKDMVYLDASRVELHYEMPLNEIIYDFFDALKSRTRGYGSLDYELIGYRPSRLVKLDILLNGDVVDALSFILFADNAYPRARKICEKLKENIPRAQFEIPVQAAIGGKVIARETIKALRKDVLAKCYGGDITRKKKLLEKQKEGKKRMRTFGTVAVPSEAFMAVLKLDED
jgi:GTP-binding protein LepA